MIYNFDAGIDRKGTSSVKWDYLEKIFGNKEVIPMWVADMDFAAPQPVIDAVVERAKHGVYGYTEKPASFYTSVTRWVKKRHGWHVSSDWITVCPGVVPALNLCVQAFTEPGDKVLLQSPVYPPFFASIRNNDRVLVNSPLRLIDNKYTIDFEDLETKLAGGVKAMIICSPHNPVGRVWSREELEKVGALCVKYNVLLISDEIHSDLIYKNYKHTPAASLAPEISERTITCLAPSKTFNIAGFATSLAIISNKELRDKFNRYLAQLGFDSTNLFGITALEAAYNYGEEWLDQALAYLEGNLDFLMNFLAEKLPRIKVSRPEGTYLVWLDCRDLGMKQKELVNFLIHKANVGLNDGTAFGDDGEGFMRMNIACTRSTLEEGLKRIEKAVNSL
ncbi:MAG: MalY/PatB family protein [Pseudomonadota bacterium]